MVINCAHYEITYFIEVIFISSDTHRAGKCIGECKKNARTNIREGRTDYYMDTDNERYTHTLPWGYREYGN